jgi:hypothetical protein
MSALVLDIETLGDAAQLEAVREMAEAAGKEPEAFAALSPPLARVVCVGMRHLESKREVAFLDASRFGKAPESFPYTGTGLVALGGEAGVLKAANDALGKVSTLITFNGRAFDVPVLVNRMVSLGVKPCDFLLRAARESRYPNWKGTPRLHVDVREQMTFFGACNGAGQTLRAFAIGYGLEDPKANGCGAGVAALVKGGDTATLAEYCLGDVRTTAALYERWLALCGIA